jgi:4-hydroxy-tetrahydrodipicolinate synthase
MQTDFLKGTGVALVTPFNEDKSIDFNSLEKLLNHVSQGVDYLVVMGTTGESVALSAEERKKVVSFVKEHNSKKLPLVLGLGGNHTQKLIQSINNTDFNNVDAVLSVSPYYNKPSQEGIYAHYSAVSKALPVPLIMYNVPGRTGSNMEAVTSIKLAEDHDNIVAVKEAAGDMDQLMQLIKNKPDNFHVVSGEDALTYSAIALGGSGVISVVANAYPVAFSNMVRNALKGNFDVARQMHYQLIDLINMLFAEGNPCGVKTALTAMDICKKDVRLPLTDVSEELKNAIFESVKQIG